METPFVLSVIGPDRPGIVESIASTVEGAGGNWLESRMCRLGGQFAGILSVSVPRDSKESFLEAIAALEGKGLSIVARESEQEPELICREVATVEIVGHDRPGIVNQISKALAKRGVNVEDLTTECRSAPMSGEALFEARARVCIPADCDSDALRDDLERIASDLMVDVTFESA